MSGGTTADLYPGDNSGKERGRILNLLKIRIILSIDASSRRYQAGYENLTRK